MKRSWWRRERRSLLLLPAALLLVAVATASRVDDYWWSAGFHERAEAADGWTQVDDYYDDGYLTYPIRAEVRLTSAEVADELPESSFEIDVADGAEVWKVDLDWRADPDVALRGCKLALVGGDDVIYEAGTGGWDATTLGLGDKCLPADRYGPAQVSGSTAQPVVPEDEQPRPREWSSTAYVVTADGFDADAVRIWWYKPRYAELPLG